MPLNRPKSSEVSEANILSPEMPTKVRAPGGFWSPHRVERPSPPQSPESAVKPRLHRRRMDRMSRKRVILEELSPLSAILLLTSTHLISPQPPHPHRSRQPRLNSARRSHHHQPHFRPSLCFNAKHPSPWPSPTTTSSRSRARTSPASSTP